ncbi:MAG: helix-turn-helix domain-containing protein, partial [Cetobacterium sp.]
KNESYIKNKRLEIVRYANDFGIKPAARFYSCSKNTIKKWCKRYAVYGIEGLKDKSRRPLNSPKKIKEVDIEKITSTAKEAKEKKKHITVNNVRRKTRIDNYSDTTINRYINKALGKNKNPKHEKSNGGDIEWKKELEPWDLIQVDIKYLTDIDNLKPYFTCLANEYKGIRSKYQITARDVTTGYTIVSYCEDKSLVYTTKFLNEILYPFLKQFKKLELKNITIQTDNGKEFTNRLTKTSGKEPKKSSFTIFIEDKFKKHRTNIPGHCTADSEVESFHWSIERDCLAWDDIIDDDSLIKYTSKYIKEYSNTIIKTRGYSPIEKIKEAFDTTNIVYP